jgi:L-lactate dehydrogenase complex protein LldE
MKVALFLSCVNDGLFPNTGQSVVEVLERLGHHVSFPTAQTCCGQMHFNSGYREEGLRLAQHFRDVFETCDVVVSPSASCVGAVRELYAGAARATGQHALEKEFEELRTRVYEFSEFLTQVAGVTDVGARFPHRVAYHPTCHSLRVLGLHDGPRTLLAHVRDLELVDFVGEDECCGFGGMFALKNAEVSVAIGTDKFNHVHASNAEVLCALDNSCLTHIGGIASRQGAGLRTMHLAEILASQG